MLDMIWLGGLPPHSPKPTRKACRDDRLAQMLDAATSDAARDRQRLRWLVLACERCGRCKEMPPRM